MAKSNKPLSKKINTVSSSQMNMPLDPGRREFLSHGAMLLSAIALSACGGGGKGSNAVVTPPVQPPLPNSGDTPGALSPTTHIQKILVIGGGMSGLVAGYELRRAGHDVTILEARERLGGRVHTLFTPFSDGQFAEAGASRIPSNHDLTRAYAAHFGLTLDTFYANSGNYASLQGTSRTLIDASDYINQPPWPGSVNRSAYSKIRGGMSQLPTAFAQDLEDIIFLNSVAKSVEQSNEQVVITTEDGQLHTADILLCTVPLPVLNKISFSPALSSQKTAAANGAYTYSPSTRVYSQFEQRFWQNDGLNGWGETNRPEEIWQPTWDDPGSKGIVLSYLRGFAAQQFDLLSAQQQLDSVLDNWQLAFPGARSNLTNSYIFSWAKEEFSGAAFADPSSNEEATYASHLRQSEGRIYFAGEHASNYHGWIQGALESGIRAAQEIHSADQG